MEQSFNIFDIIFLSLIGVFSLIGLLRGFVKETFSIINLILAALITVYTRPMITALLIEKVKIPIIADTISSAVVFTTTIVVISLITSNLSKAISELVPGYVNNPIGLLFGFLKAYLIMAIVVVTMFSVYEVDEWGNGEEKLPSIVLDARTYNFVKYGANLIRPLMDKTLERKMLEQEDAIGDILEDETIQEKGEEVGKKVIRKKLEDKGYTDDQIDKMELLIDVVTD
ncbi:CvpA family protein [Pseudomonadota bacterium]